MKHYIDYEHPWVHEPSFVNQNPWDLLQKIILDFNNLKENRPPKAWVFDLDSTLFSVSHRLKRILASYLRAQDRFDYRWHWLYTHLGPEEHRYSVRETFEAILKGLDSQRAQEWSFELWRDFEDFWMEGFFSDQFVRYDEPYPGSVEFVQAVHQKGFEVIYLTGRDRPRTFAGTFESLRRSGFPLDLHCHLYMKPEKTLSDLAYKEKIILQIRKNFQVLVSVDNEPENLVMFAEKLPESEIVFFHSIMSPRVPPAKSYDLILGKRTAWRWENYLKNRARPNIGIPFNDRKR